ncbi:hypothetical protein BDP27DRAFT_1341777 [Rhodocollybia butyracea]|uniref:Uncharacterized protein n=1 Tax=Rhodocollybia butyracea TaxID=206335 RepID=A0A9P5P5K3_9AGAR|nr:hypothetical protein BDP27DRAFT_1341777 [Rhodocollybia butyracea]
MTSAPKLPDSIVNVGNAEAGTPWGDVYILRSDTVVKRCAKVSAPATEATMLSFISIHLSPFLAYADMSQTNGMVTFLWRKALSNVSTRFGLPILLCKISSLHGCFADTFANFSIGLQQRTIIIISQGQCQTILRSVKEYDIFISFPFDQKGVLSNLPKSF